LCFGRNPCLVFPMYAKRGHLRGGGQSIRDHHNNFNYRITLKGAGWTLVDGTPGDRGGAHSFKRLELTVAWAHNAGTWSRSSIQHPIVRHSTRRGVGVGGCGWRAADGSGQRPAIWFFVRVAGGQRHEFTMRLKVSADPLSFTLAGWAIWRSIPAAGCSAGRFRYGPSGRTRSGKGPVGTTLSRTARGLGQHKRQT